MTSDRNLRIRELAWRSCARRARPLFLARLPEDAPIRFLDYEETNRHRKLFSAVIESSPEEVVRDLRDKWPAVSSLWNREEIVIWVPARNLEIGCAELPFGFLADHLDFFLDEEQGALYVTAPDMRRGFCYLPGETENVLQMWRRD